MPYKLVGATVMVKKGGKWHVLKRHETREKALAHLAKLEINVKGEHK